MNILSIQSSVSFGHVGNSGAVFPMQRLGHEVWPVHTVNFSNHTEYPSWRGPKIPPKHVADVLDGMSFAYPDVDVVLTGYLGSSSLASVIVEAVEEIKQANPDAEWVCDPVIGNAKVGSFVDEDIPGIFKDEIIPLADAICPNQWELALLTDSELNTIEETIEAARSLKERALITSVDTGDPDTIGMLDIDGDFAWYVETPRIGGNVVGAGDLAAAMYTALIDETPKDRLEHIASSLYGMVVAAQKTTRLDNSFAGLPLVERQDLIVEPEDSFVAVPYAGMDHLSQFTDTPEGFRSGFVSFVGRPNTGKSTLTNALVGEKIAIMADQPETTRHPIRGIVNRDDAQIVVVDTPGLHRPRTLLGERLNEVVKDTFADVDVIGITIPANEKIGPGDRWILDAVMKTKPGTPIVGIVTKLDRVGKDQVGEQLVRLHEMLVEATGNENVDVVPVSAKENVQLDVLLDVLAKNLPEGPRFYPEDHITDEDIETRIAELIREEALRGLRDELPHSVAVQIDEMLPETDDRGNTRTKIYAVLYLERPGQKAIIEGRDGRRLSGIIQRSRKQIMDLVGQNVYLDLRIKVLKNWQSDPKHLGRLGF